MPIYKYRPVSNISTIWESLGTFWGSFEDKELVETFWSGLLSAAKYVQRDLYYLTLSRTLSTLPPIIESEHDFYTVYFSGVNQNSVSAGSGYYWYDLPKYTYYISGVYTVSFSGAINSDVYTLLNSGIDYYHEASTDYRLQLVNIPSGTESIKYYITHSKKINPILLDIYGASVGYDFSLWVSNKYTPYVNAFGNDSTSLTSALNLMPYEDLKAINLKYLIWGLYHFQRNAINISGFEQGLSIAAGKPFAWYSGLVVSADANSIILDHGNQYLYRYIQYSGNVSEPGYTQFTNSLVGNETFQPFETLFNNVRLTVSDYTVNTSLITGLVNPYQYRRTVVVTADENVLSGLTQANNDGLLYTAYMKSLFPKSLHVYFYGKGYASGLNGLLNLAPVEYVGPTNKNVYVGSRTVIPLSWYPVPFADSYNIYYGEGTVSGFIGTGLVSLYANVEDTTINFYPTLSGNLTRWVRWKVHPVTQGYESSNANYVSFSYTRIG